jgi:hypothetical protein
MSFTTHVTLFPASGVGKREVFLETAEIAAACLNR